MTAGRRIQQGLRALTAFSVHIDKNLAREYLNPEQLRLFQSLSRSEQFHSLRVLQDVLIQEERTPPDLASAALLHDVGKIRYRLAVWQKTLAVLMHRFTPTLYERWAEQEELTWLKVGCVVSRHHPRWGGELLREINSPERVVWLVEHHQDDAENWRGHPHFALLRRLQEADEIN